MDKTSQLIILAFILDCCIGDPQNPLHPVRMIGGVIGAGTDIYKKMNIKNNAVSFLLGMLLSVVTVALTYFSARCLLHLLYGAGYWLGFFSEVVLCYFVIAAKALKTESMQVYYALEANDMTEARRRLSYIVGRDTEHLTQSGIIRATVETIAENLSDGVIAPLIFVFIGGAPLGLAYKAVNTLDSMIGYRNETYEYFGKFAARLDDAVNFVPARVSAVFMLLATLFTCDTRFGRAVNTYLKDRHKHKSPNSAQTEAVCAGALGIRLGGDSYYGGKLVHKPEIGDYTAEPEIGHIIKANRLMYAAAVLAVAAMAAARRAFNV